MASKIWKNRIALGVVMSAGNGPCSLFVVMGIYHLETINDTGTAAREINYSKVNGINLFMNNIAVI